MINDGINEGMPPDISVFFFIFSLEVLLWGSTEVRGRISVHGTHVVNFSVLFCQRYLIRRSYLFYESYGNISVLFDVAGPPCC